MHVIDMSNALPLPLLQHAGMAPNPEMQPSGASDSIPSASDSAAGQQQQQQQQQQPMPRPSMMQRLQDAAKALKREVLAMYYAMQDPRTPFLAKVIPFMVLAYAVSPL